MAPVVGLPAIGRMAVAGALLALAACNATPGPEHQESLLELQADAAHVSVAEAEADLAAGRYVPARDKFARLVAGDQQDMKAKLGLA
jgi:hypothetical protein